MFRRTVAVGVLAAVATLAARPAAAALVSLDAVQAVTPASTFGLDFGDGAGFRNVNITETVFTMELDQRGTPDAWTAKFNSYAQQVPALELPDGQGGTLSTGAITVSIVPGSSSGTLVELPDGTFEFTTTDTYEISFAGDLSAIGVFSPVTLSGTTTGLSAPDDLRAVGATGLVDIEWEGTQELGSSGILLAYRCNVAASYISTVVPEPASLGLLAGGLIFVARRRR
jgi:hypothetical protein